MKNNSIDIESKLAEIAKECFNIETLETRNSDSLDFHEVAVWQIKAALDKAFLIGWETPRKVQRES